MGLFLSARERIAIFLDNSSTLPHTPKATHSGRLFSWRKIAPVYFLSAVIPPPAEGCGMDRKRRAVVVAAGIFSAVELL